MQLKTALLLVYSFSVYLTGVANAAAPTSCLSSSSTFEDLVDCLNDYTVPASTYDASSYAAAQPTTAQLSAWSSAVQTLMSVGISGFTCAAAIATISTTNAVYGIYTFAMFNDTSTSASYCVLIESTATVANKYSKGWGFLAVPASLVSSRLHLSAPHPGADANTPQQAGALFKLVGARSLLIAGRHRQSYNTATSCIIPSSDLTTYYKTDPAHDDAQPFFAASVALYNAQSAAAGGCPIASCAFLQLHGKSSTTCTSDDIFLSSGLGNGTSSTTWYTDATYRPVKGLKAALLASNAFPTSTISLPSDDPACTLTATTNVFGRFLNGVAPANVCTTAATAAGASGRFVHAEQTSASRTVTAYVPWTNALQATF
ncbi:hypothetical protein BKA62DRAFT_828961 [Auriculariales sp. MPI-PUGE-AT-0066]|nr:hypothetical protein BKA62DRAFT_828961 [Auriculariales sp. MPI-PUGE-AT-0066]